MKKGAGGPTWRRFTETLELDSKRVDSYIVDGSWMASLVVVYFAVFLLALALLHCNCSH